MVKTLDSFSTLLSLLTGTFLLEDEFYQPSQENISKAVADHQAAFTRLKKNLAEAQSERLCGGPSAGLAGGGGDPYEDAVDSLTRLAQHLNGLRSGTSLQYELAQAHRDGKVAIRRHSVHGNTLANVLETELAKGKATSVELGNTENVMLRAAAAVFGDLVSELDSPLRALSVSRTMFHIVSMWAIALSVYLFMIHLFFFSVGHHLSLWTPYGHLVDQSTCTRAIGHLRGAFSDQGRTSADAESVLDEFIEVANGIQRALFQFDSTSSHAVLRLYQRADAYGSTSHSSTASPSSEDSSKPFLFGSESEHVFLVYLYVRHHVVPNWVLTCSLVSCRAVPASYSPCRSLRGSSSR